MKKNKLINIVFVLGFLLLIIGVFAFMKISKSASLFSTDRTYFLPQYTSIFCEELNTKIQERYDLFDKNNLQNKGVKIESYQLGLITSDVRIRFYCGSNNANGYIPYKCNYLIKNNDGLTSIKVISSDTNKILGFGATDKETTSNLNQGETLFIQYIGTKIQFDANDFLVELSAQPYGLRSFGADGRVWQEGTCDVTQIANFRGKAPEASKSNIIPPSESQYIITGVTPVRRSIDIINCNNEAVYIANIGGYYPTFDDKGESYVDMRPNKEIKNSNIHCVPSNGFCKAENCKTTQVTNEPNPTVGTCSQLLGTGVLGYGYSKTENGITIECKRGCNTQGNVITTTDCRQIQQCSGDKPYRDPVSGECKGFTQIQEPVISGFNFLPIYIAVLGLLVIVSVLIYRMRQRK